MKALTRFLKDGDIVYIRWRVTHEEGVSPAEELGTIILHLRELFFRVEESTSFLPFPKAHISCTPIDATSCRVQHG
jgi:hypothetical protein